MTTNNGIWVFLSHSNKDFERVRILRNLLEENGFRPIMLYLRSKENPSKTEELRYLIFNEIDHRNRFIYCKSPNAEESTCVKDEIKHIKSKDKVFETVDITSPESSIKKQLGVFRKRSNIFIAYQRDDVELAKAAAIRLKKYKLNVWINYSDLRAGNDFHKEIQNALLNAVNNGYVITLMNGRMLNPHGWTRAELRMALQKGVHIEESPIPVVQDRLLWKKIVDDKELQSLYYINI